VNGILLALVLAAGCARLRGDSLGTIDYDLFDLQTITRADGSVELQFTYRGDTPLTEVALFPVIKHNDGWHWQIEPIPFAEWRPNQTITITSDDAYRRHGHERLRDVKLVLEAHRDGKRVYVTKTFPNEGEHAKYQAAPPRQ
jgi:hypothetical protein